jgi:hypothetical protein
MCFLFAVTVSVQRGLCDAVFASGDDVTYVSVTVASALWRTQQ